jgi:diguanylate cyclase (GGDEF)-like protein
MLQGFTAANASPRHRRYFIVIASLLTLAAIIAFLVAEQPLAQLPAFLPAYASAVIVTDLITAYMIFAHAPLAHRPALLALAGAYLYSGTMVIGQMLVFPGVWSEHGLLGAGPQSAVWLWTFWHGGFPAIIIASTLLAYYQRKQDLTFAFSGKTSSQIAVLVIVIVFLLVALVTAGQSLLPEIITGGDYHSLSQSIEGRAVVVLNLIALLAVLLTTRGRTVLDLGLVIAVLASLIDAVLTLRAGARFSLGWYLARICSVISAISVLIVYLREVTWLYARVIRLNVQLEEQVSTDVTTHLHNRRYFNRQLTIALRDAQRRNEDLSLLMIDIDHFKFYNDHYGHQAGDEALYKVAMAIQDALRRPVDIAARYGGEEFAVILPSTSAAGAAHVAGNVLASVQQRAIPHAASPTASVITVSIGAATISGASTPEILIGRADEALYAAKRQGRNRLVSAAPLSQAPASRVAR